ncbi:MAG: tetratricopeptide repeat protein [Lachnospiraceae bacterium]|nr:tetratricopeptide repeat protein [Lachnospiraceae bacterium]
MKRKGSMVVLIVLLLVLTACGESTTDQWQEQYDLGQKYLLEEDYEAAIVAFTAAIEIDPNEAAAYIGLADTYIGSANIDKAMEILQDAKEIMPDNDDIDKKIVELYKYQLDEANGDMEQIEKISESVLLLENGEEELYLQLAELYRSQVMYEEAIDVIERGQEVCGDSENLKASLEELEGEHREILFSFIPVEAASASRRYGDYDDDGTHELFASIHRMDEVEDEEGSQLWTAYYCKDDECTEIYSYYVYERENGCFGGREDIFGGLANFLHGYYVYSENNNKSMMVTQYYLFSVIDNQPILVKYEDSGVEIKFNDFSQYIEEQLTEP